MVEYLTVLISLVIGIIIGWILKGRSQPADSTAMQSKITKLTDEKARAEARLEQLDEVRVLIEKLEDKKNLLGIIDETQQAEGLQIFIGSENNLFGLTGCSTIISPFKNKEKEIIGAIGVIGPMRINYAKIIPVVDYTAKLIGKNLGLLKK